MGDKPRQDLGALGSAVEKLRKPESDWATPTTEVELLRCPVGANCSHSVKKLRKITANAIKFKKIVKLFQSYRVLKYNFQVLGLGFGLEGQVLGPGLEDKSLALALALKVKCLALALRTNLWPWHWP